MSDKKYRLSNGQQFDTAQGVDGYIRGLELVRNEIADELSDEHAAKFRTWLDEAHSVKAAGPSTETPEEPVQPAEAAEGAGSESQAGEAGSAAEQAAA